jgi:hypothetical protein
VIYHVIIHVNFSMMKMNFYFLSGRRESNPVYTHPMGAYYRHTSARFDISIFAYKKKEFHPPFFTLLTFCCFLFAPGICQFFYTGYRFLCVFRLVTLPIVDWDNVVSREQGCSAREEASVHRPFLRFFHKEDRLLP